MRRAKDGKEFERILRRAQRAPAVAVRVGVLGNAELAEAAAANEYGKGVPRRSFIRGSLQEIEQALPRAVVPIVKANRGVVTVAAGAAAGRTAAGIIKQTIKGFSNPPNAPATIQAKGRNDPLTDTGELADSIRFEVESGS